MTERRTPYRRSQRTEEKIRRRRLRAFVRFETVRATVNSYEAIDRAWRWVLRWDAALYPSQGYVTVQE